jgi:hypothetical protein
MAFAWKLSKGSMWYPTYHMAYSRLDEMNGTMGVLEKYEVPEQHTFTPVPIDKVVRVSISCLENHYANLLKIPSEGKKFVWGGSENRGYYFRTKKEAKKHVGYQNKVWQQNGVVEQYEVDAGVDVHAAI